MFGVLPLRPAYGRDYKTEDQLKADWELDKDFMCASGQYINKSDFERIKELNGIKIISFYYFHETKITTIERN